MIKILMRSIRQYRGLSLLSPLLVATETGIETFIPFLMGNIIDQGIMKGDMTYITRMGFFLIMIAIFSLMMGAGASWVSATAAAGFVANLREDLFKNIQTFSFTNIDRFSSSSLVTRLTTDITNVQMAYQMLIRMAVRAPFLLLFSILMAFNVNASLAMIFVVVAPLLAVSLTIILQLARPLFRQVFNRYDVLNRVVRENVRGIRVVKTYVQQEREINKFQNASTGIYRLFSKAQRIMSLNAPIMMLMLNGSLLLLSWFGAKMIVAGTLQTGQLVSLYAYSNSILFSLNMLAMIITQLSISQASGNRIAEVLNEQTTIADPKNPVTKVRDGAVTFDSVSFIYDTNRKKTQSLSDINLNFKSGQVIGIMGSTGSGKSTLVQMIPRLYDVTSGTVKVGGVDVKNYDLRTLRDNVAMVLQSSVLFSGTIAENLRWGNPDATTEQLVQAAKVAQADNFINEFPDGYNTMISQDGDNVSGGQRQRLAIARALLKDPKVLILDDSTSAVDTSTEQQIRIGLRQQMPETTKIIISQRIVSIMDADQIIVLDHGQIQDIGTHDELLAKNALYHDIYTYQVGEGGAQ